jgi:hypothetical protein
VKSGNHYHKASVLLGLPERAASIKVGNSLWLIWSCYWWKKKECYE